MKMKTQQPKTYAAKSLKSCPTLCDPMDCSLPGSSVHGIFQARVLKWVAIAFSYTKPMGHCKSSAKRKVYSNTGIPQETRK